MEFKSIDIVMDPKPQTFREFFQAEVMSRDSSELTDDDIVMLYQSGSTTIRDLCNKCGKSIGDVYRILRKRNLHPNRRHLKHDNVSSLAKSGFSIQAIADLTGYTPRNVRYILSKKPEDK